MSLRVKKYKVGFIGTGLIADKHLDIIIKLSKTKKLPQLDIVGQIKLNPKKAKDKFGKLFVNVDHFIKTTHPDVIYLCTPPFARFPYEKKLIENNISYFVEKPTLNDKPNEIIRLLNQKTKKNLVIQAGFHWRYLKLTNIIKKHLKEYPIRLIAGLRFNCLPFQNWKLDKKLSGGSLYERLIHMVDLCQYLLQGNLKQIEYFNNKPTLNQKIETKCGLSDSEVLVFKINDVLCNISSASYISNNNLLEMKFIGQKNIYNLHLNNAGKLELEIITDNHVTKKYTEDPELAYEKENIFFWQSFLKRDIDTLLNYKRDITLGTLVYNKITDNK